MITTDSIMMLLADKAVISRSTESACELIGEVDPDMAALFLSRPFHRQSIVSALFASLVDAGFESAYRVRVALNLNPLAGEPL